ARAVGIVSFDEQGVAVGGERDTAIAHGCNAGRDAAIAERDGVGGYIVKYQNIVLWRGAQLVEAEDAVVVAHHHQGTIRREAYGDAGTAQQARVVAVAVNSIEARLACGASVDVVDGAAIDAVPEGGAGRAHGNLL